MLFPYKFLNQRRFSVVDVDLDLSDLRVRCDEVPVLRFEDWRQIVEAFRA